MADPIIAPVINGNPNPNEVKVVDCLAYDLSQISVANGYYTDGMLVDRRRDPRQVTQNRPEEYRAKNAMARIKLMDMDEMAKGSIGMGAAGFKRMKQQIVIMTCQSLTKPQSDQGITADQLKGWMRHDIFRMINNDALLGTASAYLTANFSGWGAVPSCINLKVTKVKAGPIVESVVPDIYQLFFLEFLQDEFGTNMAAGRGLG